MSSRGIVATHIRVHREINGSPGERFAVCPRKRPLFCRSIATGSKKGTTQKVAFGQDDLHTGHAARTSSPRRSRGSPDQYVDAPKATQTLPRLLQQRHLLLSKRSDSCRSESSISVVSTPGAVGLGTPSVLLVVMSRSKCASIDRLNNP